MTRAQHVRRILDAIDPDQRARLRQVPASTMQELGLTVSHVETLTSSRGAGGLCDGVSFSRQNTILYAPTDSRREHFTLLHEYGHLLVAKDTPALNWLADRDDPPAEIEMMCNEIAAALLIPDDILDGVVGGGPITGEHLLTLFNEVPTASQIVCAIALSRRLGCSGAILLTDRATNKVVFAAPVGEPGIYPRPDQDLPAGHPLRDIDRGEFVRRKSFWSAPWGTRRTFYLDATASTKRTYSVLADIDLWGIERLHLSPVESEDTARPTSALTCNCGYDGTVTGWPCPGCERPYCPRCKECDCARRTAASGLCSACFLTAPHADLIGGVCSGCR
jgi:hypothetical protein